MPAAQAAMRHAWAPGCRRAEGRIRGAPDDGKDFRSRAAGVVVRKGTKCCPFFLLVFHTTRHIFSFFFIWTKLLFSSFWFLYILFSLHSIFGSLCFLFDSSCSPTSLYSAFGSDFYLASAHHHIFSLDMLFFPHKKLISDSCL